MNSSHTASASAASTSSSSSSSIRGFPKKKMVPSPLFSCITAYSKDELSLILLGEQKLALSTNPNEERYVDVALLSIIATERMTSGRTLTHPEQLLELYSWIYTTLQFSSCDMSVLVSALAHIDEFYRRLDVDEIVEYLHFLFLGAYMAAARSIHGELGYATFWVRATRGMFCAEELHRMEVAFSEMICEWREEESEGGTEGDVQSGDDDFSVESAPSDSAVAIASNPDPCSTVTRPDFNIETPSPDIRKPPIHATSIVTSPPRALPVRGRALLGKRRTEAQIQCTLEAAGARLKRSAIQQSSPYAMKVLNMTELSAQVQDTLTTFTYYTTN